jgi:hypothetical protein
MRESTIATQVDTISGMEEVVHQAPMPYVEDELNMQYMVH